MVNNYFAQIKLYRADSDVRSILDFISNIQTASDSFNTLYNSVASRIGVWRSDSGFDSYGVLVSGSIGHNTSGPRDCGILYGYDCSCPYNASKDVAWGFVVADIDTNFTGLSNIDLIITNWESILLAENISTDSKEIDKGYKMWKEKYSSANVKYLSVLNSKNKKTVSLIKEQQVLESYQPLPLI